MYSKQLSKQLMKIFKLVTKTLQNHCQYKCKFLKTKAFWIINNAESIKNKAKSIYSYDFARLYTNIPHDLLHDNIEFVLKETINKQIRNLSR